MGKMVKLRFDTSTTNLCNGLFSIEYIRLKCLIGLKATNSYVFAEAIIDTGAYISIVPGGLAEKIQKEIKGKDKLKGINLREECAIHVDIGKTNCILFDEEYNFTSEMEIPAAFTKTDDVPLILGFANLLSRFQVYFDHRKKTAYIEW